MFLLERAATESGLAVNAACDPDPQRLCIAERLCPQVTEEVSDLLARTDLSAILVDAPPAERVSLGRQVFAAGKDLVVTPPVAEVLDAAETLFDAAESAGRRVILWSPWHAEADFQMAAATIRADVIGRPHFFRFERWELLADDCCETSHEAAGPREEAIVAMLDELIVLSEQPAKSVIATPLAEGGLSVTVRFVNGPIGLLTLHAARATRFDHGWAIDAERGGYAAGRRWVRTADGETYHVPAEATAAPTLEQILVSADESPQATRRTSLRLIALRNAVRQSLETGAVAPVEATE